MAKIFSLVLLVALVAISLQLATAGLFGHKKPANDKPIPPGVIVDPVTGLYLDQPAPPVRPPYKTHRAQ